MLNFQGNKINENLLEIRVFSKQKQQDVGGLIAVYMVLGLALMARQRFKRTKARAIDFV